MQTAGSFVTLLFAATFEGRCLFEECAVVGGSGDLHKAWQEPLQAQSVGCYHCLCAQKAHSIQLMETDDAMGISSSFFYPQIITAYQYLQCIQHETFINCSVAQFFFLTGVIMVR